MKSLVLFLALATPAADWPQFLGPDRNGVYGGPAISVSWAGDGPARLWEKKVGQGFAGPAVVGGRVILFHRVGDKEVIESLAAATGASQWRHEYATSYRDDFGFDEGPRSVPVVAESIIYSFGAEGVLSAVALETGKPLWSVRTADRFKVAKNFFGAAGSPLVLDSRVLLNVGGAEAGLVAFDAKTGELLWSATRDEASYSSPTSAMLGSERLALFYTRAGLEIVDPATGAVKQQFPWRSRSRASVNAASPLVIDDVIFLSASYGTGAAALRFGTSGLTKLWSSDEALSSHYATAVHRDGVLYGFHGRQEYGQSFRAVELLTGKVLWNEDGFGAGTVTLAGDKLVIVREAGELVVAEAAPKGFRALARARLLKGTVRAYPALADGVIYIRNENTLAAFDLRTKP
ncbi:MAG TPA: PQQ-binding-like beta-propeller repeat protein [Vicinamibacteria bacterium]|nr:PQQ-binding-like beta-propeller repeat protein [Vicinamibacteria bacterium]